MKFLLLFLYTFSTSLLGFAAKPPGPKKKDAGISNLYIISIGIDDFKGQKDIYVNGKELYFKVLPNLKGCVSDARSISDKIEYDVKKLTNPDTSLRLKLYSFLLTGDAANKDSIKSVFDFIAREAKPGDGFILFYAGITRENRNHETFLIPHLRRTTDSIFENPDLIPLTTIARWMNSIQAKNQIVISEAGNGEPFSLNLIDKLFEDNALLASQDLRNRIIITTRLYGLDYHSCDEKSGPGGPLAFCLLESDNILDAFKNSHLFEFELHKIEYNCKISSIFPYTTIYRESDFTSFLTKKAFKTRGPGFVNPSSAVPKVSRVINNFALVVGTNKYDNKPDWQNLDNPNRDAESVAGILAKKYGFKVRVIYDRPKDTIVKEIIKYNQILSENDNFILFVAGHGYYDTSFSDGFIVFSGSRLIKDDPSRESYLPMASLGRLLDNLPSKRVFAIFDICFGAYFDIKAKDLVLTDYRISSQAEADTLLNRKNKLTSRIFLASGKGSVPDFWSNNYDHSPFADKVLKSFEEETYFTSPGKLYKAVELNVTEPVLKEFGSHSTRGDIILRVKK